uniref:Uncharacterized protein n=1 Tax=Peronospora matthiolae TaxID=2874970 RepID=A0AAV1TYL1_9STRA
MGWSVARFIRACFAMTAMYSCRSLLLRVAKMPRTFCMASVLSPSICRRVTPRSAAARAEQQRGVLVRARPHYGAAGLEQRSAGADRARVARQVPSNRSYHSPSTSGSSLKFFSSLSSSFSPPPSLDLARGDGWQCLTPPRCEAVVVPSVGQVYCLDETQREK